jgi:hypothetical protein
VSAANGVVVAAVAPIAATAPRVVTARRGPSVSRNAATHLPKEAQSAAPKAVNRANPGSRAKRAKAAASDARARLTRLLTVPMAQPQIFAVSS